MPDSSVRQATNQVPPLIDYDLIAADPAVRAGLAAAGTTVTPELAALAIAAGSAEVIERAGLANVHPPVLHTHDRSGERIDEVEFHPAWHTLMSRAVAAGLHGTPWAPGAGQHAHLQRAAGFYLLTQTESGHMCPISMTYAAVPVIRQHPELAAAYCPGLQSTRYDFGLRPPGSKRGLLAGMSMTEKQGGSDVRANTTTANPVGGSASAADEYRLNGHKWFTSAPMNDVFLTLAQAPGGLTCFLLPRVLPDGERNRLRLLRLKDKLGNRTAGTGVGTGDSAAQEAALLRLALPSAKFWVCKRAVPMIAEALECLGGNGYVESFPMARLLRESPLNGIWEGSGTGQRTGRGARAGPLTGLRRRAAHRTRPCGRPAPCLGRRGDQTEIPALGRRRPGLGQNHGVTDRAAVRGCAAVRHAPADVAEIYCATRLGDRGDRVFGDLPPGLRLADVVAAAPTTRTRRPETDDPNPTTRSRRPEARRSGQRSGHLVPLQVGHRTHPRPRHRGRRLPDRTRDRTRDRTARG